MGATVSASGSRFGRNSGLGNSGGDNGALSASSQNFAPAYDASSGWSFATGNGSINAYQSSEFLEFRALTRAIVAAHSNRRCRDF